MGCDEPWQGSAWSEIATVTDARVQIPIAITNGQQAYHLSNVIYEELQSDEDDRSPESIIVFPILWNPSKAQPTEDDDTSWNITITNMVTKGTYKPVASTPRDTMLFHEFIDSSAVI